MKILLTGGGTGGHFYPIIAIAEELNTQIRADKIINAKLYFMSPSPYDKALLFDNNLIFIKSYAGKIRLYPSLLNILDIPIAILGAIRAIWDLFWIYPDVVFSKGGYGSFPTLFAARFLLIPVIIHESDSVPGKVSKWSGKFARRVALSYDEASSYFKAEKVAVTGQPIRRELITPLKFGAKEFLKLEEHLPIIFITCGSQGSVIINDVIVRALPTLLTKYQVIHQVGPANVEQVKKDVAFVLGDSPHKERYKMFGYLSVLAMRMSAGVSDIIIARAGSTIFEIALWGIPSIIIPITNSNGNHQRENAYAYARTGSAVVIEESNLTENIVLSEIDRIISDLDSRNKMIAGTKSFAKSNAAKDIADEILKFSITHER